jgi:cytochrome c peroxidase
MNNNKIDLTTETTYSDGVNHLPPPPPWRWRRCTWVAAVMAMTMLIGTAVAAPLDLPRPMESLKNVPVPKPDNLKEFILDEKAAIKLGKALFWDMQVGSDGVMSCASCHFHAGTDSRSKNQLHPGPDAIVEQGINYNLTPEDFPFHKLENPDDRSSKVESSINDIVGGHGVFLSKFNKTIPGEPVDDMTVVTDPVFTLSGVNTRQVTGRSTPSVINAVFNFRNFWDGRAQNIFNGVNPFGLRDPNARVLKAVKKGQLDPVSVRLNNSSLASQAVGPPLSAVEESGTGRAFPDVGQKFQGSFKTKKAPKDTSVKIRALVPLGQQLVAPDDSVLGKLSNSGKNGLQRGLNKSYEAMIKDAFKSEWWDSNLLINVDSNGNLSFVPSKQPKKPTPSDIHPVTPPDELAPRQYTQMDYNFALFMGLAIQMYESTLVSDDAPIDQHLAVGKKAKPVLTAQQESGKAIFEGRGKCSGCHDGAEFTDASVGAVKGDRLERMIVGDGGQAVYDKGFYNIGVRPTEDDLGVGGNDPFGNSLSESRLAQQGKFEQLLGESPNIQVSRDERIVADGAFKVPTLRNVELTAPYFHNGGKLTLRQVVEHYDRGGDFHERNIENLDADIENLNLSAQDIDDLVAFLEALTDDRVRYDKAPFDHPQLFVPNGHPGDNNSVTNNGYGNATDSLLEIQAVGNGGGAGTPSFLSVPQ